MSDAQKQQLDLLGFDFELPDDMKAPEKTEFDEGFAELKKCVVALCFYFILL